MPKINKPKKIVKKTANEKPTLESPNLKKMEKALDDLGENWLWQKEFTEYYSLSKFCVERYGKLFGDYKIRCSGQIIWTGSVETAKKLREMC